VFRAHTIAWVNLVVGLSVGMAAQPLRGMAAPLEVAQVSGRPSKAHVALNNAIEAYRRGDYEVADRFFHEAMDRQADLTSTEVQELTSLMQANLNALQARRDGASQLRSLEKALSLGYTGEAAEWLKQVTNNEQYLAVADRQRLESIRKANPRLATMPRSPATGPSPVPAPVPTGPASPPPPQPPGRPSATNPAPFPAGQPIANPSQEAHEKVAQARALLGQYEFEAAEVKAREAELLNVVFSKNEDTPRDVLKEIARARTDPKVLLAASRAALAHSDFDRAEQYAKLSSEVSSSWSFRLWGDTPAKALKDIQEARVKAGQEKKPEGTTTAVRTPAGSQPDAAKPEAPRESGGMFSRLNPFASKPKPEQQVAQGPAPAPLPPENPNSRPGTNPVTTTTTPYPKPPAERSLPPSGSGPGASGTPVTDYRNPAQLAPLDPRPIQPATTIPTQPMGPTSAQGPAPPTPGSVTPTVALNNATSPAGSTVQPLSGNPTPALPSNVAPGQPTPAGALRPPAAQANKVVLQPIAQVDESDAARALIQQARAAFQEGDLMRAEQLCSQARQKKTNLAYWEDNPERLQTDINTARARTNPTNQAKTDNALMTKEQAVALIHQARTQLAEGRLDDAIQTTLKLQGLPPSMKWGLFEDNPENLKQHVEKLRVKRDREESVKVLAEARMLLEKGDLDNASKAAYKAQKLHGTYTVWDFGDRPARVQADIETARAKLNRPQVNPSPAALAANAAPPQPGNENKNPGNQPATQQALTTIQQNPGGVLPASNSVPAPDNRPFGQQPNLQALPVPTPNPTGPNPPVRNPNVSMLPGPKPAPENEARKLLADARAALQKGDTVQARRCADQVLLMNVVLNQPGDDSPAAIYRDIDAVAMAKMRGQPVAGQPDNRGTANPGQALLNPDKLKAQQLLVQARTFQRQGRLIEARTTAIEAQNLHVQFAPSEDSPETVLAELSAQARTFIDNLQRRASETASFGKAPPQQRYEAAEKDLLQARQLAVAFGQDYLPIDARIGQVRAARNGLAGQATAQNQAPSPPPQSPQGQGLALLDKARLEIKAGNTATARQLVLEASDEKYGIRDQAMFVLRSIDAEEGRQHALEACRTFDAAMQAYRRSDFRYASNLIASFDPRLLDNERRERLKEVMSTREMQTGPAGTTSVVQATDRGISSAVRPAALPPTPVPAGNSGLASATDAHQPGILETTQAMRVVLFQKLRSEGLEVQRQATEKFRAGDTEEALQMMQNYLVQLDYAQLDPAQMNLLRRPVEQRQNQLKLIKAQTDWMKSDKLAKDTVKHQHSDKVTAEMNKQQKVADLMRQYNTLYKDGKYLEAERVAQLARELDPDNPIAAAGYQIAHNQRTLTASKKGAADRAEMNLEAWRDAEVEGDPSVIEKKEVFDPKIWERTKNRKPGGSITSLRKSDKEREIEHRLSTPINLSFTDTPLKQVIEDIRTWQGINIYVDTPALEAQGVTLDRPVTIKLEQISLKSALNLLLHGAHLTHIIKDECLQITTEENAKGKQTTVTYLVADLIIPVEDYGGPKSPATPAMQMMSPQAPPADSPTPSLGGIGSLIGGTAVSTATGPPSQQPTTAGMMGMGVTKGRSGNTQEEQLIKLITSAIQPKSWSDMGGAGTIDYFPLTMSLVVNQTPDIQEQVADLLAALRRLQDQEVAVEVRFISIAEDFYERIGIDFNLNIPTTGGPIGNAATSTLANNLVTGTNVFPTGYPSQFAPGRFLAGITPAGSFTPALNIPINDTSFLAAVPAFGGYSGAGGLALGLAFLSDIQVFLFMEAVQGDVRSNVMQAPRITLFNGQNATLSVSDTQNFVTGVIVQAVGNGNFVFQPNVTTLPFQATLVNIQAIISADRRFVRLSLQPQLINIIPGSPVPTFPITVPIFPGAGVNSPVVFTQYIQQPRFTAITVQTTVSVPDGGTVLLGGLKRLSEARNEFGPPILSKLPYIDRLFKNVSYGRETTNLLIMVTPRIIIQEEEQERATGFVEPTPNNP
jgi:type II secretory pathway component GspD/PulD (secretin)